MQGTEKRLRILRFSHSGVVSMYRQRERELCKLFPVDVRLVIPEFWPHLGADKPQDELTEQCFELRKIGTIATGNIPLFAYDPRAVVRHLKEFRPDIVDIHEEPYSVSCFEIIWLMRRFSPQSVCCFYTAQNIKKNYPPPFSWSEQYVYANSAAAYPCSKGAGDVLLAKGFKNSIRVIPLGVALDALAAGSGNGWPATGKATVGYFGRLQWCKGVHNLLSALARLKEDIDFQLMIVGSGDDREKLQSLAQAEGIAHKVSWLGERKAEEIPSLMRQCSVIVVPSITTPSWKEQFGRVPVEAMSLGVPVIVSDSGSLPEVVQAAGLIYRENNVEELSALLRRIMTDTACREQICQAATALVQERYSWQKVASSSYQMYLSLSK